jgi:hypothetical protein
MRRCHFEQVQAGEQRRQRISQLVAERGEEFVLAAVGVAASVSSARRALSQVGPNLILALARAQLPCGSR